MSRSPAPWKVLRATFDLSTFVADAKGEPVARLASNSSARGMAKARSGQTEANAALIAAAPDLLDALRLALKVLDLLAKDDDCTEGQPEAAHAARAAIAKAEAGK
jgi:hypothetical protein